MMWEIPLSNGETYAVGDNGKGVFVKRDEQKEFSRIAGDRVKFSHIKQFKRWLSYNLGKHEKRAGV